MSNKTQKKSIYKKSAKIKKQINKGGFIRTLYKPPIITRRSTIKELVPYSKELTPYSKELTPSPLRKLAKTVAKSRIAKTLKKRILMSKQAKIAKELLNNPECAICLENIHQEDATLTKCNHVFHSTCLDNWLSKPTSRLACPKCRAKIRKTSSTSVSGLTLSQIEQLRIEMQDINPEIINPEMQNELITTLCHYQKVHWILKEKINLVKTSYPRLYARFYPTDKEARMKEYMNTYETLIKKIIAIYSDVFPDFKHLFQAIYNSNDFPFSMTLETIAHQLQSSVAQVKDIYEDDQPLKINLNFWVDSVEDAFTDIEHDTRFEPIMVIADIMVDSNS